MRLGNTVGGKGMAIHPLACFKFHADAIVGKGGRNGNLPIAHVIQALHGAHGFNGRPYIIRYALRAFGVPLIGLTRRECVNIGHISRVWAFWRNRGITRGVARVLATFKGNFMSPKSAPFDSSPQRGEPERCNLAPLSEESFIEI